MADPSAVRGASHGSPPHGDAAVLVAHEGAHLRQSAQRLLSLSAIHVETVGTGAEAIALARARTFDLALVHWNLPDVSGLQVGRVFREERITTPWILMSGFLTSEAVVEARHLGALRAVNMPFDVEAVVLEALGEAGRAARWPAPPVAPRLREPASAAERWAGLVLKACSNDVDLQTLSKWASCVGVSYSALTEACRRAGVAPADAKDFMRMLSVLWRTRGETAHLGELLLTSDYRTLSRLLDRAGLSTRGPRSIVSLDEYLTRQQFIAPRSHALDALRSLLADFSLR
jgi:ActR/RegA family two-component response regulator